MLSGIGPEKHLAEMSIPIICSLNVGKNLQDHIGLGGLAFLINKELILYLFLSYKTIMMTAFIQAHCSEL